MSSEILVDRMRSDDDVRQGLCQAGGPVRSWQSEQDGSVPQRRPHLVIDVIDDVVREISAIRMSATQQAAASETILHSAQHVPRRTICEMVSEHAS